MWDDVRSLYQYMAKRILAAGGWVEFNRVNGNLALSRALGDFVFKRNDSIPPEQQIVTAYPDVITENVTEDHEFVVLACDGIWDVLSNQEVVDFVRERLAENRDPQTICEELLTRCLAPDSQMGGVGCDNMTVVIVGLLQKQSPEHLVSKCARPSRADQSKRNDVTTEDGVRQSAEKEKSPESELEEEDEAPPAEFTA
ncbi:PPM-type phosphatase domain-containing protein [Trichostrongylus colubriformis]|uniref:protein-serine/threonine phosphatase n=1 Tax=Trichostrongylus colubriformis TaxID=6319 RepID=A0AAN8FRC7_TRICO